MQISIHAPREGSDRTLRACTRRRPRISIHAPREGSDRFIVTVLALLYNNFYPRSPRGERRRQARPGHQDQHFYPRSPRGERLGCTFLIGAMVAISIHAPREGSDHRMHHVRLRNPPHFYPRSPRGERRVLGVACGFPVVISIHAPREGSDPLGDALSQRDDQHFYPRSPRGERPASARKRKLGEKFLSTLPARGATLCDGDLLGGFIISIHAPREGSDQRRLDSIPPRPISIHAPREGSDEVFQRFLVTLFDFYPRSPRGERPCAILYSIGGETIFLSTLPARGATKVYNTDTARKIDFYPRSPRGERPT